MEYRENVHQQQDEILTKENHLLNRNSGTKIVSFKSRIVNIKMKLQVNFNG